MAEELITNRPTISDLTGDNHFAKLARNYWLGKSKVKKVQPDVVKAEIWDVLAKDGFPHASLLLLEQLQALDRYLWPGYSEDASDQHTILLALLVNVKRQEGVPVWSAFVSKPDLFSAFFRRVLHLAIDRDTAISSRAYLVKFLVGAFQSLDTGIIRKECASLVSISIWHNLHSEHVRTNLLGRTVQLGKAWRAAGKRYDGADAETQARLRFERSWLFSLVLDFANILYDTETSSGKDKITYCELVLELLSDLLSQLPTRRYANTLLQDLNLITIISLSPLYANEDNTLLRELTVLLQHFMTFPIEDHTGREMTASDIDEKHDAVLSRLQKVAMQNFKDKLTILALSNFKSLDSREEFEGHLKYLSDDELQQLCSALQIRTEYPQSSLITRDRQFFNEVLVVHHERRPTYRQIVRDMTILPTEDTIYERTLDRTEEYNGSKPLAVPKLNLQYLTVSDFLWRSFVLYRCESFFEVRKHIEDTIRRIQPRQAGTGLRFDGFSQMAIPITKPALIDVAPPRVGESYPAQVQIEVTLDVSRFTPNVRQQWETFRQEDVVFLVTVDAQPAGRAITNGSSNTPPHRTIKYLRCAQVVSVLDEDGKPLREQKPGYVNGTGRVRKRRLLLDLDPAAYEKDKNRPEVLEGMNLVIRRRGRENNFKPILESIRNLVLSETPAPTWLREVFLGYSDPSAATYKNLATHLKSIDFRDTFLDWSHLIESLPGKTVEPDESKDSSFPPPYILETMSAKVAVEPPQKRRKKDRDERPPNETAAETVKVTTYKPKNNGPYPSDAPRVNQVRFTPAQVEAITSGTQPGLTVIVGPPGTGKTDVATQIVSNLYHDFPNQRTLLVAHSNQALNQLFQKITALDIDERHLLRLGHGEEELETEGDYSKHGRIEALEERSAQCLYEVNRLAASIGAHGVHGKDCETAEYFEQVYIQPAWRRFWDVANSATDPSAVAAAFPFYGYFATAPQPLFPSDVTLEQALDIAQGCKTHLDQIFATISSSRPFDLLRVQKDKSNYLLQHSARIVAMTSTHAAMHRFSIAALDFHYDTIIMEEAAQITEIETFIPLSLQKPVNGSNPLQRIILIGDHLQNAPVISNASLRAHAHLDQSLFLRLSRLGVPSILLDAQGRARPSLAALYAWRYPRLTNLPHTTNSAPFTLANAGLRYTSQFIEVGPYKDRGESTPSPHFVQNLGEAEYAVALFQYMRLLGYPASSITILTTYSGQRALIRDVLNHRCKGNRLFGFPRAVSTVDRYQGEQNDFVILSLVRTERVGFARDVRRLTVALSRARLGLYVLGRRELWESVLEVKGVFERLWDGGGGDGGEKGKADGRLAVVTGEMYPTDRLEGDESVDGAEGRVARLEGVEHLGQYVFEMTKAKVEDLKKGVARLDDPDMVLVGGGSDEEEEEGPAERVVEGDGDAGMVGE